MLVFASNVFDRQAYITLVQRADNKAKFDLESSSCLTTNDWKIFEAVRINDTSIALITYDDYGGKSGNELLNVKYYKGEMKM